MKNVMYYLSIGTIGLAFALTSHANMVFFKLLKSTYPDAKTLHKCIMCHEKPPTLNYFGRDFHGHNFDLKAIEGL
ncbi:MAG: hypothetical protein HY843_07065, partial [Bdellovibrio sp.]|nr:hypothetical protein [Bdellovibrio sp.]